MTDKILLIQTGGTIDKDYPKTKLGYAFEINEPASGRIIQRSKMNCDNVEVVTVCRKDSQDIDMTDRMAIAQSCKRSDAKKVLITHGTDTMVETAAFLAEQDLQQTIVITGAFLPETFKNSDADFNIGFAMGSLKATDKCDIYIAMNGCLSQWSKCARDCTTDMFYSC